MKCTDYIRISLIHIKSMFDSVFEFATNSRSFAYVILTIS